MIKSNLEILTATVHATGLVIRFGFLLGLARWSSPEVIGIYSLIVSIETVVVYLSGFEFHTFTSRRYTRNATKSKLRIVISAHRYIIVATAPLAAISAIFITIAFGIAQDFLTLSLIATLVVTSSFAQELGRYLNLTRRPLASTILSQFRSTVWQPFALIFIYNHTNTDYSIEIILLLWITSITIGILWSSLILKDTWWPMAPTKRRYILTGLKTSKSYHATAILTVMQNNLERFILQLMLGPSAVGVYSFYQMLSNTLAGFIQTSILNARLADILTLFIKHQSSRFIYIENLRKRILTICIIFGLVILILTIAISLTFRVNQFIDWLFILPLLLAAQILLLWTQPAHIALYASSHDQQLLRLMLGTFAGGLALNYVFISIFELVGAAFATLTVSFALALSRNWLFANLRNLNRKDHAQKK